MPLPTLDQPTDAVQPGRATVLNSFVIVSYNSRAYLQNCLQSLIESIPSRQSEIIVVDNASSDGSAEFIADNFPEVRLIRNSSNLGFAAANNQAATMAVGQYLIALNPDTTVSPGWLEPLLQPLENAVVGATTPRILMLKQPTQINTCGNTMHYTGLTVCRGLGEMAASPSRLVSGEVAAISGACFAIRRSVWQTVGGFDPDFFTYLEDTDLSVRLWLAGYSCYYAADSVVYHDYASRFSNTKLYHLERNRWLLLLKNYRWKTLGLVSPALALSEAVTWGYTLKNGPVAALARLKAYGWLWHQRHTILKKRQMVQDLRQASDHRLFLRLAWRLDLGQLAGPALARLADFLLNPLFWLVYRVAKSLL